MIRKLIKWEIVIVCLLEGLSLVRSTNIYTNVGQDITITCPVNDVFSWTYLKTKETLALCSGQNIINSNSTISKRLRISSDCRLQISEFKREDAGQYVCFHPNKIKDGEMKHIINIQLRIQPNVSLRVYINSVLQKKKQIVFVKEGDMFELVCHLLTPGTIETFRWTNNFQELPNSKNNLLFEKAERDISGTYVCTAENLAGDADSDAVTVSIEYPPLVKNKNRVFAAEDKPRILKCEVSGVPNIYQFKKWQHLVNGQHIRYLDGNDNGILALAYNNTSDLQYDDSGLYICYVTNNIRSEKGQLWQKGTVNVTIKGKPVLAKTHKQVVIVQNISTTRVALYLLSSSELSASNVFKGKFERVQTTQCAASTVNTIFHGTPVNVSGYVCIFSFTETEGKSFHNYSIKVSNGCCFNIFNFSIRSTREPVKPNVLEFTSSTTWINVLLEIESGSGLHQELIIEYRKQQSKSWISLSVENIETSRVIYNIPSLDPNTAYEFRFFARNALGNSSSTETYNVWTKDENKSLWIRNTIVIIVTVVLTVCVIIIGWRRLKGGKNESHRSSITEDSNQGGAIENSLYQSVSDLTEPPTASGIMETSNRSMNSRNSIVNRQIVGYDIVQKAESTRQLDCEELTYREEKNINCDSSTLNYVEVVFEPFEAKSKFYIHGADNRTPYADIDLSRTADPLNFSDEESVSSPEDNNDFVTLEDVQQWNIHDS